MKRLLRRTSFQTLCLLLLSCAKDAGPTGPAAPPPVLSAAQPADAFVASVDAAGGKPTFLWATGAVAAPRGATAEGAARFHLGRLTHAYALPADAARGVELVDVHRGEAGAIIAVLAQRVDGVEVYPGRVKVVMKPNLDLVAISGTLRAGVVGRGGFALAPADALAGALSTHFGTRVAASDLAGRGRAEGGYDRLALAAAPAARGGVLRLDEPARVKPIYHPVGDALVPAYFVEFFAQAGEGTASEAYRYLVGAADGKILERTDLTSDVAFTYRVWADSTGLKTPFHGPQADYLPHPTGVSDGTDPAYVAPNVVVMDAFNVGPSGLPDPWLGAGATETAGNNVDAYTDIAVPNGYTNGDLRATTTGTRAFERVYDPAQQPLASAGQQMAAVTQLFYVTNWLHDYWYNSGFNEAAGNAQLNNFGRGGLGNDVLLAETQDNFLGGSRNNANMATPADGSSPRMQMFVFNGPEVRHLTLEPGGLELQSTTPPAFGPRSFDVTGQIVLGVDATAPVNDGCQAMTNDVAGKIVLMDRAGGCTSFTTKVKNAQNAGATGVIIANHLLGPPLRFDLSGADPSITIAAMAIAKVDGDTLKASLQTDTISARLFRLSELDRDGSLDNMVIAHEWGHYMHHRLADPCGLNQCRSTSEGWGDFLALHMLLREGDHLDGTYGNGIYAAKLFGDSAYSGIRRFPYSVDFSKNGLTLKHIVNGTPLPDGSDNDRPNAQVHDSGEVWASTLWEVYVALQKDRLATGSTRTFAQVQRRMADYVVAGLKAMPPHATFVEQRDAILAAIAASDAHDLEVASAAFARRGLGSCAVAAPRESVDHVGTLESFAASANLGVASVALDATTLTCDGDDVLDAGELGRITVQIVNGSAVASPGADVTVASSAPELVFVNGATVHVPAIAAYGATTVSFDVSLAASVTGIQDLTFAVTVADPASCQPTFTVATLARGNTDVALATSRLDDVEADVSAWTADGLAAWTRRADDALHHRWHGADLALSSDVKLVSPELQVSASQPFVITFKHRFVFEADAVNAYDGGVVELSSDGGQTWKDVATLGVAPGYTGKLVATGSNPLIGRDAFVRENATHPAYETVTLDLGTQLAGQTVKLRFRIGTDGSAGAEGWDIDDLGFAGIDNTPFHRLVDDQPSVCPTAPQARAGDDQLVASGALVALDASASTDVNGGALTFAWAQTAGPNVALNGAGAAIAAFRAPVVAVSTRLSFQLTVGDGSFTSTDAIDVVVLPPPLPDAGLPDAAPPVPDAEVPDATPPMPDAAIPDATPPAPDATPPTPDADVPTSAVDAAIPAPTPDASPTTTPPDDGCGCRVGARSSSRGAPLGGGLTLLALGGLLIARRRRSLR